VKYGFGAKPDPARIDDYAAAGVTRTVFGGN
jgi:hypothetical protein